MQTMKEKIVPIGNPAAAKPQKRETSSSLSTSVRDLWFVGLENAWRHDEPLFPRAVINLSRSKEPEAGEFESLTYDPPSFTHLRSYVLISHLLQH